MSAETEKAAREFEALHEKWKSMRRPISLLLVEDNLWDADQIQRVVDEYSAFTCVAVTGREAVECLKKSDFDIVLLDLRLNADMDGNDVLRWMKSQGKTVPVVVITGVSDDSPDVNEAMTLGAKCAIQKPLTLENARMILGALR